MESRGLFLMQSREGEDLVNIPKPNIKAAQTRADAAKAKLDEIAARHKTEIEAAQSELWAAEATVRRQEALAKLAKIVADAPDVLAALKANKPGDCPNGVARGLVFRPVRPALYRWTTTGELVRSLITELEAANATNP